MNITILKVTIRELVVTVRIQSLYLSDKNDFENKKYSNLKSINIYVRK